MSYTIVDLLEKLIALEQAACGMYRGLAQQAENRNTRLGTTARVLAKEEERHVEFYRNLRQEASKFEDINIGFDIYDKASSLINQFKKRIAVPRLEDSKALVKFAIEFEKENIALLLDIQGRMVKNEGDVLNTVYMAISDLIAEESKHVKSLEVFLKS